MNDGLEEMESDFELMKRTRGIVPPGWSRAHKAAPCHPPKVKTTLRTDCVTLRRRPSADRGVSAAN